MKNRIIAIIAERTSETIHDDLPFTALGLDSLEFVEMIQEVENVSGVLVKDEDLATIQAIGDLLDYIDHRAPIDNYVSS